MHYRYKIFQNILKQKDTEEVVVTFVEVKFS